MNRHYFTDTASATLEYAGDGELTTETDDFDPSVAETVERDGPWTDFFDTNEFVQFDATVAQPIVQPYVHDGELKLFKKEEDELRKAQAQLDNLAWTVDHPPHDRVMTSEQIRGFWENPRWNDGQEATLNVPTDDTDALRYAVTNDEVSVGFSGELDWADDDADTEYDAVQRNMAYDHVASVESGRCPPEKGCGLHTDSAENDDAHGHVFDDAVKTQSTEENPTPNTAENWDEGDWVSFTVDDSHVESSGHPSSDEDDEVDSETVHGKIAHVDSERALVKRYDTDEEVFADESTTVATDNLREWVGPYADSCPGDTCSCGCHLDDSRGESSGQSVSHETDDLHDDESAQNNNQQNNDYNTMTDIQTLIDEHDLTAEQVLDHLADSQGESAIESALADAFDVERKESPQDFYDGEPSVEDLADDFDAVDLLVDEKESLVEERDSLREEVREAKRPVFADKAERLAEMTQKFGDEEDIMDRFDADDEDEKWTIETIDDKIELVEDIKSEETTTVTDTDGGDSGEETTDTDLEQTRHGGFDLRSRTRVE